MFWTRWGINQKADMVEGGDLTFIIDKAGLENTSLSL